MVVQTSDHLRGTHCTVRYSVSSLIHTFIIDAPLQAMFFNGASLNSADIKRQLAAVIHQSCIVG